MSELRLGRREALSGSLAVVLAAAPGVRNGNGVTHFALSHHDAELVHGKPYQSLFREAFFAWFSEGSKRFALPASLGAVTSTCTQLYIHGIHPAIHVSIEDCSDINVYVEWEGVGWDQLLWLYASERPIQAGVGWMDEAVFPEFRFIYPTREALWRANVFEELLAWINEDLAQATHLAMWGSAEDATWARLARDGKVLRAGWTIAENGGTPAHFLQVHGHVA